MRRGPVRSRVGSDLALRWAWGVGVPITWQGEEEEDKGGPGKRCHLRLGLGRGSGHFHRDGIWGLPYPGVRGEEQGRISEVSFGA